MTARGLKDVWEAQPPIVRKLAIGASATAVAAGLVRAYLRAEKTKRVPRGYHTRNLTEPVKRAEDAEIHRDGYSLKKVPTDLDAIVIGSGIGGLTFAALLARAGRRCLVLEQHYMAGGCTHCFEEGGYEFDTGLHYVGNIEKRKKYLDLVTEPKVDWDQMGRHPWDKAKGCYDEVYIGDATGLGGKWKSYNLNAGADKYIEELAGHFPSERAAIEEYVRLCQKISQKDVFFGVKIARPAWLGRLLNTVAGSSFWEMNKKTALEVIQSLTKNTDLQSVLLGQFGDYGQTPSTESFFMHASVANHYFNGGFYPRGGTSVIAKAMIPVIEKTGGRVLVRKGVERILLDGKGRACGVRMSNGDEIFSKIVCSGAGALNTYKELLPPESVPRWLMEKIDSVGPSCSMFYLFVGMTGSPSELKLRSANIWHWPEGDYDRMLDKFYGDPMKEPMPAFIGFPCSKDSTWETRYPGRSNAIVLTMCKYEWFEEWAQKRQGHRGEDYEAKKAMLKERCLEILFHHYPHLKDKVDYTMSGSSLTFNYYIGSRRGEVYGLESHPMRFEKQDWLRPQSHIPGLYLTGQDVTTLGVTGAMMGGILTAHAALGYGGPVDLISGRNLIEDLWHLEAKSGAKIE